jgi:hypothetical protein
MMKKATLTLAFLALAASTALATPSTQVWIPSTDIQPAGKFHYGVDVYAPTEKTVLGVWNSPLVVQGLTYGAIGSDKVGVEVGIDLKAGLGDLDAHPLYFNAKVGMPEGALFAGSPAVAVGGFDFGQTDATANNLIYAVAAKTVGSFGRFSVGYFTGKEDLLGKDENSGVMASWDRTLTEISPKLWAAIDYQAGKSGYGATNFGISWAFSDNVSVIYGYDIYNNDAFPSTYTVQVDINF